MFQRSIQALFLLLFLVLLFLAADLVTLSLPADIYLRLSPLLATSAMIAARTIIPGTIVSVILLIGTAVFGRFFCGYVCPLGTTIDFADWLAIRGIRSSIKGRRKREGREKNGDRMKSLQSLKYYLLAFLVVSSIFSFTLVHALDPISLATRTYAFLLRPLAFILANLFLDILRPLSGRFNWVALSLSRFPEIYYVSNLITFLIFVAILSLSVVHSRFWCRNLCPLGALLSLVSRVSMLRRIVRSGCINCGKCQEQCPMGAIKEDPYQTSVRECIQCRKCVLVCPVNVVSFRPTNLTLFKTETYRPESGLSRRGFLAAASSGIAASFLASSHPTVILQSPGLIRPPGALPEALFLDTCIRCGSCMNICPTNTLQPVMLEAGLARLWSPRLIQRLAPCEATCNLCGQLCPTQAIRSLQQSEKVVAKIGTAKIDRRMCLAWEHDRLCLICDEQCPYNAIELKDVEGLKRPIVFEHRCAGCGMCESKCPIEGESAIIVLPVGEVRLREGSYIAEAKRRNLDLKLVEKESVGGNAEQEVFGEMDLGFDADNLPPLPPGFITDDEIKKLKESTGR